MTGADRGRGGGPGFFSPGGRWQVHTGRMSRRPRPPRPAPAAPPSLADWRGFSAQRRKPQFGLLGFLAILAVGSTMFVAFVDRQNASHFLDAWVFSLVALQLLVVAESRHLFRGAPRWIVPLACAIVVPLLAGTVLHARTEAAIVLAVVFLGLVVAPERWLENLVAGPRD